MKIPKHRKFKVNDLVVVKVDRKRQRGFNAGWGEAMSRLVGSGEICKVINMAEDQAPVVRVQTPRGVTWWFPTKALKFVGRGE